MRFLEVICDFSWIFRENEKFFVFFVPSKILGGPGFVAFFLRLVGGRSLCDTDFSWIFRGPRKLFVFFVSSKTLRGPGFVAFILRPMVVYSVKKCLLDTI